MIYYWIIVLLNSIQGLELSNLQTGFLALFSVIFIVKRDEKLGLQMLLAFLILPIYLFINTEGWYYLIFTGLMTAWSVWIQKRTEIGYLIYNHTNICLAFYKGKNHSYKGILSSLIGHNVSSVDLLYRGKLYRYKSGRLIEANQAIDEYIMFDTGIKPDKETDKIFNEIIKNQFKSKIYLANCTEILMPMLDKLGIAPNGYLNKIPSIYIRSLLKNARR